MSERARRTAPLLLAIVLGLLSVGAGAVIALSDDDADRAAVPSISPTSSTPTATATPTPTVEPTPSGTPSPTPARPVLDDGAHFVYVTEATPQDDGSLRVTFDLAYFLTGEAGERAAAEHDEEFVNDYYIVNDNPRLRTIPVAADAVIRYLPVGGPPTELRRGDLDAWLEAILGTSQTDYGGRDVPWWFTVRDGVVTRIEQQYLP